MSEFIITSEQFERVCEVVLDQTNLPITEVIIGGDELPEIVRCRDCKHFRIEPWDEVLAAQYGAPPMICERTGDMDDADPGGFCSWGERGEVKMPDKTDNLAHALNNLHNALSALAVDYSATGNMSEKVGKQITLDLHLACGELCEYWKVKEIDGIERGE